MGYEELTAPGAMTGRDTPDRAYAVEEAGIRQTVEDFVALGATTLPGGKLCNLSNN